MCDRLKENTSEDYENVDTPIFYSSKFDEYGLKILDGGNSKITIEFCPWCGQKLPTSKRDRWFDELKKLGVKDPWTETLPDKYLTDQWYRGHLSS